MPPVNIIQKLEQEQYILSEWLRSVDGVTDTENLSQIHSHEKEAMPDRSRRQLLAATALVVSFASLLYSASDLFHLSAQRDDSEIIEHLHHDEIDIATNQRSIRLLNKTVAGMITELETLNHFQTQYVMWSRAKEYLDYMMWGWYRITDGLGSLTMHQLSPRLLGPTELKKAILKIARRVERNGYVLGIKEIDDLYKLPVSHLAFRNGTVILFVHIPIKRTEQPLSVFQYLNAPFKFQNDSVAVPILKERYLMIDDDSSSYKSITPEMFALCQLSESKVNCPDDGVYHTSENMDCLAALFMRRNKPVYEKCNWIFNPTENMVTQVGGNEYLVYFGVESQLELKCGKQSWGQRFKGLKSVKIPPGCVGYHVDFVLYGRMDVVTELSEVIHRELEVSALLDQADWTEQHLSVAVSDLSLVGSSQGISIPKMKIAYENLTWQQLINKILIAGGLAVGLLIVCVCCCKGRKIILARLRKQFSPEPSMQLSTIESAPPPDYNLKRKVY